MTPALSDNCFACGLDQPTDWRIDHDIQLTIQGNDDCRKHATDDWRHIFDGSPIKFSNSMMPDALLDRFGWVR